jgi:hypothetical protein
VEFLYVRKRFVVVIGVVIVLLLTDIVFVWPSPCAPAGNNNHITNVINQNQAANSGNGGNEGSGGGGDLPTCRILCSVIK